MEGLSENDSEKQRRKRGRPGIRDIDPGSWAFAHKCVPDEATSGRSIANQVYINNAIAVLRTGLRTVEGAENRRTYGWLMRIDGDDPDWFQRIKLRRTILCELGRIDDDDALRIIARAICERKPPTQDAVANIRRWRLERDGRGDVAGLHGELIRHVNGYLRRYPATPWGDVAEAVRDLLAAVEASADGDDEDD